MINVNVCSGISYNVNTQEYLVERCLSDDQQLLDALTPGPLLDSDLLALDESALRSQLPDIVESVNNSTGLDTQSLVSTNHIVNDQTSQNVAQIFIKTEHCEKAVDAYKIFIKTEHCEEAVDAYNQETLRRSQRQMELRSNHTEEQLCKY